jgi:macrolide-specific efflux system membrane fusion protein
MARPGSTVITDSPADITQELSLGDEEELLFEELSFWKRRRAVIVTVVVVVLAGTGGLVYWLTSGSSPATGLVVTTQVVPVTTGTIQQTVASSGTIQPASQANLNFAVAGTVTAVTVKAGQTVTSGQVLATLSTTALTEQVNAAQAQLASANARLAADQAAGASTSQVDSDQAAIASAQSSLSSAQTSLSDASLTSTISGTVASVSLSVGQQVTGSGNGNSSGTSSAQIVVIGTNSYIVNATVDDTQIGQIADGDQVTIVPTGSSTTDYGTVASVSLIGSQSSNVTTFPVVIDITGNPSGLFAGSSAAVNIIVKQLNNVTEVPTAAITYDSSGQATVTQVVNGAHVVKPVTVGAAANGQTQITSGVKAGDKVLEQVISFKGGTGASGGGLFGGPGGRFSGNGRIPGGGGFPGGGGGPVTFNNGAGG